MTSFRKRTVQKPIRGTRTSPHTAQVITSSGNPYLDVVIGGGLPMGSICLIEEDRFMTHAKVLAKYFLAEGVLSKQEIFLGSLDDIPAEMLRRLPKPLTELETEVEQREEQAQGGGGAENGLRIAWRYNDLPLVNSEHATAKIGHHFNLMEQMDSMMLYYTNTTMWDDSHKEPDIVIAEEYSKSSSPNSSSLEQQPVEDAPPIPGLDTTSQEKIPPQEETSVNNNNNNNSSSVTSSTKTGSQESQSQVFHNARYGGLLNDIQQLLRDESFVAGTKKNLCRVCLTSLGSPLWYDDNFGEDLIKFLTLLMASVRNCNSVCLITMPMHLIAKYDASLVPKIRQLVDYAIELESFAGSERETHPAFKEYSGLLHLHKMSALNTLAVHMPDTTDLAFKLRRKKFVIEKFHLPPELQETSAKPDSCISGLLSNSNATASLDF
ncbi:LOW QUALITY PROTEIN: putative elongator complex protein 4 [Drosophila eugracilis]|uniref:LOW QUALITY PROTEIN: putative elongator complex protein 4 n=1 Tax=Drosophila eugracilis TaxID=29029 RepID=UPI001BD9CF60|nr:LOW QUALITY PROTEIN: putative elongator complex protein 4 [Drosophila eugracilis]